MRINNTVFPDDGTVRAVRNPLGADFPTMYHMVYQVYGQDVVFEIGNRARMVELFGEGWAEGLADAGIGVSGAQQAEIEQMVGWGMFDEKVGTQESLQSDVERRVREMGLEDIPKWMRAEDTMFALISAARDGSSAGATVRALAETRGFRQRFSGFREFRQGQGGGTILEIAERYIVEEATIRESLKRYRPSGTDSSNRYIGSLISTGWVAGEIDQVLRGERIMRNNPEALVELNEILAFSGIDPVDEHGFLDLMLDPEGLEQSTGVVFDAINAALRAAALQEEGIDIDPELAMELGEAGALAVASATQQGVYSTAAQQAAFVLIQNQRELATNRYGITQEDVIAAAFGEGFSGEIEAKLQKFGRERQAAAKGYGGGAGYVDDRGRLVIPGLKGL